MCAAQIMPQGKSCPQDASYPEWDTSFFTVVKQCAETPVIGSLTFFGEETRRKFVWRVVGNAFTAFAMAGAGCSAGAGGFVYTFAGHTGNLQIIISYQ